jgi:hypothetical protein
MLRISGAGRCWSRQVIAKRRLVAMGQVSVQPTNVRDPSAYSMCVSARAWVGQVLCGVVTVPGQPTNGTDGVLIWLAGTFALADGVGTTVGLLLMAKPSGSSLEHCHTIPCAGGSDFVDVEARTAVPR